MLILKTIRLSMVLSAIRGEIGLRAGEFIGGR